MKANAIKFKRHRPGVYSVSMFGLGYSINQNRAGGWTLSQGSKDFEPFATLQDLRRFLAETFWNIEEDVNSR